MKLPSPVLRFSLTLAWMVTAAAMMIGELKAAPGEAAVGRPAFKNISVEQFDKLRADTNNVVLDVRTKREYDAGHIAGAKNIDWNSPDFAKEVAKLEPGKTYLVHCAAGVRSAKACEAMSKLSFTNCYNLEPGFRGWQKAGKPVEH